MTAKDHIANKARPSVRTPVPRCRPTLAQPAWSEAFARARAMAEADVSELSPAAMLSSDDVAARTGHLSAVVGELACSLTDHAGDPAALRLALARLAACSIAWLEEIDAG